MLRSFRLGNHRSFRDEHELLLMSAYSKDSPALPVAAVYGANASGKSNLLDGLRFMAAAVRNSFASWRPDVGVPRKPFMLDAKSRAEPSVFVAEIVVGEVRYTYGFEVDDVRVRGEWLYSYPEKRKRVLFERSDDKVRFGSTDAELKGKLELLVELLRPNSLLISLAAQSNVAAVMPVYRWFAHAVRFRVDGDPPLIEREVAEFVLDHPDRRDQLVALLRVADFGISDLIVDTEEPAVRKIRMHRGVEINTGTSFQYIDFDDRRRHRVRLVHGEDGVLDLGDESAGTRSWLRLLPIVLPVLKNEGVLVIDEIDASLHPLLTMRLIALFNDRSTNPDGAQLIFTTHDATLLNPPFAEEVLRRDEVWFVEKDSNGVSVLYPLTDFKPRNEDNIQRRYLAGRYGAVPDLFEDNFTSAVRNS